MSRKATNSGVVWQVVAPWVRWPLRSPARLAMVLVGLTVVVVLASNLSHRGAPSDAGAGGPVGSDSASATGSPSSSDPSAASDPTTPSASLQPATSGESTAGAATGIPSSPAAVAVAPPAGTSSDGAPASVASRFVTLWARPDQPQPAWSEALQPMSSESFAHQLSTVLPGNVPAHAVVGAQPAVLTGAQASVVVTTDAGTVRVALSQAAQGWRVDSIAPEQLTPTGGAGSTIAPSYAPIPAS